MYIPIGCGASDSMLFSDKPMSLKQNVLHLQLETFGSRHNKLVLGVYDQVRHKPCSAVSKDGWGLNISELGSRWTSLSMHMQKKKKLSHDASYEAR